MPFSVLTKYDRGCVALPLISPLFDQDLSSCSLSFWSTFNSGRFLFGMGDFGYRVSSPGTRRLPLGPLSSSIQGPPLAAASVQPRRRLRFSARGRPNYGPPAQTSGVDRRRTQRAATPTGLPQLALRGRSGLSRGLSRSQLPAGGINVGPSIPSQRHSKTGTMQSSRKGVANLAARGLIGCV